MDGVNDVIWSEIVSVVGRRNLFPRSLLTNSDNHDISQLITIFILNSKLFLANLTIKTKMIIKNDRQELINNKLINFMLYIKYREN
jgi:hypothetical protein